MIVTLPLISFLLIDIRVKEIYNMYIFFVALKLLWLISHVNVELKTTFQRFYSSLSSGSTLMLGMEEISETFVFNSTLQWLITQEDFNVFIHCESFISYIFFVLNLILCSFMIRVRLKIITG